MSCVGLPFLDLHQSWRYYPGQTPTQPVDLAARCSSYQVEHENWQAENNIQTIVSFKEPTLAHESESIHTVVAVTNDELFGILEETNRCRLYMVTKMIGFPIAILLV